MHIVCRCDSKNKTLNIFIDGQLDSTHTLASDLKWNSHPLYIGKLPDGVTHHFLILPLRFLKVFVDIGDQYNWCGFVA